MSSPRVQAVWVALALSLVVIGLVSRARSQDTPPSRAASFNADGRVTLPVGYRQWVHIGTRVKPIGIDILDGLPTKTPEIFNAYVEPGAFAALEATGRWPDGAQIVKEFSAVNVGPGCDAATMLCATPLGSGIFETGFMGLGMMVKDAARFPDGKGNWGYFSFGHRPPPYDSMAVRRPAGTCEACHVTLASDTDYVIVRAHIGSPAGLARRNERTREKNGVPTPDSDDFYASVSPFGSFDAITDHERYAPLPDAWVIGVADVVSSTEAIAQGRYKAVNTVGAAVLAAATNALPELRFPFVFGGDGASFAVPGRHAGVASDALARTARWAMDSLDLALRVAMIPVAAVRAAGFDVRVARYAASQAVSYAMFSGGGLAWADMQLKAGRFAIHPAEPGAEPDLTGLFCGFAPIKAQRGVILSLIAVPLADATAFATLVADLLSLLDGSGRSGRPFSETGPLPAWVGSGLDTSVADRAARERPFARGVSVLRAIRLRLIHATGVTVGGFSPLKYRRQLVENTDFRKFDDGLRMTVDCTPAVADAIETRLAAAQTDAVARVGSHRQASANLTCYVPSRLRSDHVHFVDGAMGGYAAAAAKLKAAVSA